MAIKGYTLIETVMALALFLLLSASAAQILTVGARTSAGMMARHELMENARVAMEFLTTNIAMAEKITIEESMDGSLRRLSLVQNRDGVSHTYVFEYNSALSPGAVKYHRLELGGNELASYIRTIRVKADAEREILAIWIETDDRLVPQAEKIAEPVILAGKVDVRYKTVR